MSDTPSLFGDSAHQSPPSGTLPAGFKYLPNFISADDERGLVEHIRTLPLREFEFHGYTGKRRVVSFGWRYDFGGRELQKVDDIQPFLLPLRDRAAAFANVATDELRHVLVTEYTPGSAIGWHRDKAVFDEVIGISLLSPCRFRFRRQVAGKWERAVLTAEPRSVYLLAGPSRTEWEHSIPAVEHLRYSITFRRLAEQRGRSSR